MHTAGDVISNSCLRIFKVVDNVWVLADYATSSKKLTNQTYLNGYHYSVFNFTSNVTFNKDEKIRVELINYKSSTNEAYNNPSYPGISTKGFYNVPTSNSKCLKAGYGFTTSDSVNPELSSFNYSVFQHQTTIYVDNTIDEILKTD
jgi:hypothetical protein